MKFFYKYNKAYHDVGFKHCRVLLLNHELTLQRRNSYLTLKKRRLLLLQGKSRTCYRVGRVVVAKCLFQHYVTPAVFSL